MNPGEVIRLWRLFGRVRMTLRWDVETATETLRLATAQVDRQLRAGDTVGTIAPDPPYMAEDLIRWNADHQAGRSPANPPTARLSSSDAAYYQRVE